jgi:DNA replication and repair protein RecF
MILKTLTLQNFRTYTKASFDFDPQTTVIIGPNAAGKTNLLEAIYLAATGKSFKSEKEGQLIQFGKTLTRVKAAIISSSRATKEPRLPDGQGGDPDQEQIKEGIASSQAPRNDVDMEELEVVLAQNPTGYLQRKYLVNGVAKRRVDFASHLRVVLFTPLDLDIVSGQPSARRTFLNEVLEQTDPEYRLAFSLYTKALRQRNALLEQTQQSGMRDEERFSYWDELLINNGQIVTQRREALIEYINKQDKPLFPFELDYDKSVISEERLAQYKHAEIGAGVTLVGPQRDDVFIKTFVEGSKTQEAVKHFSSRGQQRLVTLELKKVQISYIKEQTGEQPLLLLDDIFSELDTTHINHVLELIGHNQTILTTTHKEFVSENILKKPHVIELGDK